MQAGFMYFHLCSLCIVTLYAHVSVFRHTKLEVRIKNNNGRSGAVGE
jgi:hypothetical protein